MKLCHSHAITEKEPPQPNLTWFGKILWLLPKQFSHLYALDGYMKKLNYNTHFLMREVG